MVDSVIAGSGVAAIVPTGFEAYARSCIPSLMDSGGHHGPEDAPPLLDVFLSLFVLDFLKVEFDMGGFGSGSEAGSLGDMSAAGWATPVLGSHAGRALNHQRWRTRIELANAIFEP